MSLQSTNTTPLRRVGRILKSCVLYLWIGKTVYLGIWTTKYHSFGFLAACFLAIRDGLLTMPETAFTVVSATFSFIAGLYGELTHQLGYAPLSTTGGSFVVGGVFWLVLFCVAVLSIVQFTLWVVLKRRGVTILWRAPCIPDIFQGNMKLLYWAVCWTVAALLCLYSFSYGAITLIVTGVSLILTMRIPVLAGTPFWLLEITGVGSSGSFWSRFKTGWSKTRSHSGHNYYEDNEDGYDDGSGNEKSRQNSGPVIDKIADAHATFDLTPDTITREKLRKKYRSLMKRIHPDQDGSSRLAAIINADFDFLIQHYSWKR